MYRIDILTLFDLTVGDVLSESILGRAQERDFLRIEAHQIRDYTLNKQKQVDDYPYGGGRGAVMQADPLYQCWKHVVDTYGPGHTIYFSPAGKTFCQADAKRLAFEGVDTVEQAMRLKGKVVSIDRADVQLPAGRYFLADLMGLTVLDAADGSELGTVEDIMTPPAHNVYVVRGKGKEYLIPAVPAFIAETNVDEGYIKVNLIEGMESDV